MNTMTENEGDCIQDKSANPEMFAFISVGVVCSTNAYVAVKKDH